MKFQYLAVLLVVAIGFLPQGLEAKGKNKSIAPESLHGLQSKIDQILDAKDLASGITGIKIASAEDGKIIFERNSRKLFNPASNTKLVTTAAVLSKIPHHTFRTKLFSSAKPSGGILNGNVYVKGCGDPLFTSADIDSLAGLIQRQEIHLIKGNLLGDVSYFDTVSWGRGWMWDDEPSSDEPFVTPLSVDSNSVFVSVSPGGAAKSAAIYAVMPPCDMFAVRNEAITEAEVGTHPLKVNRLRGTNSIIIEGTIDTRSTSIEFTYSIRRPELVFLHILRARLLARGIAVDGTYALESSRGKNLLGEIDHALDAVLGRVNKESYNLGAENLLKTMAAEVTGSQGTWENGVLIEKGYLDRVGVDTSQITLVDGSGVSFYNLLTPSDIVRLLAAEYRSKANFSRFYASLPVAGIDGTLRNRMKGTRAEGNVHAKTGTLSGTSCLSGYVTTAGKELLAFSIMSNHFPGEGKLLREMQNRILELLSNWDQTQ